jgi:hypothetical protein
VKRQPKLTRDAGGHLLGKLWLRPAQPGQRAPKAPDIRVPLARSRRPEVSR